MLPSLAQLVAVVTASNAYQNILTIAQQLGLATTAWQPLGMGNTILATMSQIVAAQSGYVNLIAQGGYATTAAAMVDGAGNPITTWMDLVSSENYNNIRNPAVQASGVVGFANTISTPYGPFAVGTLHLVNPSNGATYSNTLATEQIYGAPSSTAVDSYIHFAADAAFAGSLGTAIDGAVLALTTPLPGVSVLALGAGSSSPGMVGTDAESNSALLARDLNKLGSLAPNGAGGALVYVATTQSIVAQYGTVSSPVTRAADLLNQFTGVCILYIASASGGSTTNDAAIVQTAEQALAVPTGMTLVVSPAANLNIVVNATIYVIGSVGSVSAEAEDAVAAYFALIPIGGLNGSSVGEVPISGIIAAIQSVAYLYIAEIDLTLPTGNTALAANQVPVLDGSSTFTVVQVST